MSTKAMASPDMVLTTQILKNILNILFLPGAGPWKNSVSSYSILILVITDLSITVFIAGMRLSAWPLAIGLEVVSYRFLIFQSRTYNAMLMLLPGLILSDCLLPARQAHHLLICPLFTLLCWVLGASNGICGALQDWKHLDFEAPFFSVQDYALPWISLLLSASYVCALLAPNTERFSSLESWDDFDSCSTPRRALSTAVWSLATIYLAWQSTFFGLNTMLILSLETLSTVARQVTSKFWSSDEISKSSAKVLVVRVL